MKVILYTIGKTQTREIAELEQQYLKRIRGRFTLEVRALKSEKELQQKLAQEPAAIYLLEEAGATYDSVDFAHWMEAQIANSKTLVFVIAAAEGFAEDTRALARGSLSLSPLTFPHELAKLLLIEQLYRAQTILDGHPYHK